MLLQHCQDLGAVDGLILVQEESDRSWLGWVDWVASSALPKSERIAARVVADGSPGTVDRVQLSQELCGLLEDLAVVKHHLVGVTTSFGLVYSIEHCNYRLVRAELLAKARLTCKAEDVRN